MIFLDTLTGLALCLACLCALVLVAAPLRDALLWAMDHLLVAAKRKGGTA